MLLLLVANFKILISPTISLSIFSDHTLEDIARRPQDKSPMRHQFRTQGQICTTQPLEYERGRSFAKRRGVLWIKSINFSPFHFGLSLGHFPWPTSPFQLHISLTPPPKSRTAIPGQTWMALLFAP